MSLKQIPPWRNVWNKSKFVSYFNLQCWVFYKLYLNFLKIVIGKGTITRVWFSTAFFIIGIWILANNVLPRFHKAPLPNYLVPDNISSISWQRNRVKLLQSKCRKYSNPFRPEKGVLFQDRSLGVEVVHFPTPVVPMSVCIPHKTGSKSWGIFSKKMKVAHDSESFKNYSSLNWKEKSDHAYKILVVRHPLERLVSVYRMIFEDWCDPYGIPAQSWHICSKEMFNQDFREKLLKKITASSDASHSFINFMYDSYRYSNDLYIFKIWEELHPNEELTSREQLKFTFLEFVSFLLDGSKDPFISGHNGVSYHWAPIWKECSLCSDLTMPNYIVHLDTLPKDLKLLERVGGAPRGSFEASFPHTHDQRGSLNLALEYYRTISKNQVEALADMYALDFELFGFDSMPFVQVAK